MTTTEKVSFYDSSNDTVLEIKLSIEDAARARNDMTFATSLMNAALQEQQSWKVTNNTNYNHQVSEQEEDSQTVNVEMEKENISNSDLDAKGCLYRWPTSCVLLLLQTYSANEDKFTNGKQSQKKTWEEISETMKRNGHNVTGPMCAAKLRSLKKTYKAVKDHNNKSGNDRRTWQFFEIMNEIFCKKPWCAPVAIASSSGLSTKQQEEEEENNLSLDSECTVEPSRSKQSASTLLGKRLKQKEEHEKAKAKRHKERMDMDEKFLAVLEKLANK